MIEWEIKLLTDNGRENKHRGLEREDSWNSRSGDWKERVSRSGKCGRMAGSAEVPPEVLSLTGQTNLYDGVVFSSSPGKQVAKADDGIQGTCSKFCQADETEEWWRNGLEDTSQRLTLWSNKSSLGREGKGDGKWMIDKDKKENRKSRGLSKFGKSTVETNEKN